MNPKYYWIIGVAVVFLAVAVSFFVQPVNKDEKIFYAGDLNGAADLTTTTAETDDSALSNNGSIGENAVIYNDNGYEPAILKVKKGTTVFFKNESSQPMWTASDVQPTSKTYPGSDIKKCGTEEESQIFDACDGTMPGEAWSFTFNEIGQWHYRNHLNVSHTGLIIVE